MIWAALMALGVETVPEKQRPLPFDGELSGLVCSAVWVALCMPPMVVPHCNHLSLAPCRWLHAWPSLPLLDLSALQDAVPLRSTISSVPENTCTRSNNSWEIQDQCLLEKNRTLIHYASKELVLWLCRIHVVATKTLSNVWYSTKCADWLLPKCPCLGFLSFLFFCFESEDTLRPVGIEHYCRLELLSPAHESKLAKSFAKYLPTYISLQNRHTPPQPLTTKQKSNIQNSLAIGLPCTLASLLKQLYNWLCLFPVRYVTPVTDTTISAKIYSKYCISTLPGLLPIFILFSISGWSSAPGQLTIHLKVCLILGKYDFI